MITLAIDPGTRESGFVVFDEDDMKHPIRDVGKVDNETLLTRITRGDFRDAEEVVIEQFAGYGMRVGRECFQTVHMAGRFDQAVRFAWGSPAVMIERREVKRVLCGKTTASDGDVRQCLIDWFGPGRELAIGRKAAPGPLYHVHADAWAALALARAHQEHKRWIRPGSDANARVGV